MYWGFGYRVFEKEYPNILKQVEKIIVVDGIGHSETKKMKDLFWMLQAFPIKNFEKYKSKIIVLAGSVDKLLPFYHSNLDQANLLEKKFLEETKNIILKIKNKK